MGWLDDLIAAARPASVSDRRLRTVAHDPSSATAEDIAMLMRAHGVGEVEVLTACDYLALTDVAPSVVWAWILEFDGTELSHLLACDLEHTVVVERLEGRTRGCHRAA